MENNQKIAVIAVIIVIVAAVAVYFCLPGGENDDGADFTFLIQDDSGVYFWIEGDGDTAIEAFKDATESYDVPFVPSTNNGLDSGIQSLFGLETSNASGSWVWWSQYSFVDGAWESNTVMMDQVSKDDVDYMAIVYGDGTNLPLVEPSDAVVWDKSEKGVVFTIQSDSGMYFQMNAEGKNVFDAFKNATKTFKIPFESSSYNGVENGIQSLFGLETSNASGSWVWWTQYSYVDGAWTSNSTTMEQVSTTDGKNTAIIYGDGSVKPTYKP